MRKLKIVVRTTRGALPLLVFAGVVPAAACGSKSGLQGNNSASDSGTPGGTGGTGAASGGSSATGGGGGIAIDSGTGGTAGEGFCPSFSLDEEFTVALPAEGVPAEPGQICTTVIEPVASNRAARVTLSAFVNGGQSAKGFLEIDPSLEARVLGAPKIQILDATTPALGNMQVSALQKVAGGFSFDATWPAPLSFSPGFGPGGEGFARMTAMVEFELACDPAPATRVVHAAHDLHLCLDDQRQDVEWVSSGDQCVVCRIIAEMAPSPIVSDKQSDALPLARALRLRIVELARVANSVVLFAENDGGDQLEYEWRPSVGRMERLAADVVAWTIDPGAAAPMMQVAVESDFGAAVSSFAWNEAV